MRKAKYSIKNVINGFPEDDDFSENEDDIENQENANENRRNICPVCFDRTKNAAITPCGHTLCLRLRQQNCNSAYNESLL